MKSFSKNILALGITSALSLSLFNYSHAATYEVVDKKAAENLGYSYGGKLNNQGNMAVTGANVYNFPVQFEYFDDTDFNNIVYLALTRQDYYFGLGPIEDLDAMKAGNPTANDLAWAKLYLQDMNKSNANPNFEYQIVADTAALYNLGGGSASTEICVFDTDFTGELACTDDITRSTASVIEGFNNSGIMFGTASAPYLPLAGPADSNGEIQTHWVREHGQHGFFSLDFGATITAVPPIETAFGGGISAIFDINDNGIAVGYSSYKLSEFRQSEILDETGGCADPAILADIPFEICVQTKQAGMYYIQAFKASLSATGVESAELLGLLIDPNEEDDRAFTSQALAVNNDGVAVGYAHGWDDTNVTTPSASERMTGSYAVMFKKDEAGENVVFDFNQLHYYFSTGSVYPFSSANDINNSGLVVGYTRDPSTFVKKFFYVDTSVPESEMNIVIPKDFFTTSASTAFAVNSGGIIVGEGQIESHNESSSNPRRTAGFMFDTSSESPVITDINTLLECNSAYNVIKANDINDAGQISATAIVKSQAYDALGNIIEGEMIDVVRAVMLEPIAGGVVEDCDSVEEKVERQGASFGLFGLLSLLAFIGVRRRATSS